MAVPFDLQDSRRRGNRSRSSRCRTEHRQQRPLCRLNSGLVYAAALEVGSVYALRSVNRWGGESSVALSSPALEEPRISPDGERLVLTVLKQPDADAWTYHLTRGEFKRLTEEVTEDETPVWMPDNQHVTYSSARPGQPRSIFRRRVDGGHEELLLRTDPSRDDHPHVDSWSPDGQTLALTNMNMSTSSENFDIWLLRPRDNPAVQPLLQTTFNEGAARFSPNGQWLRTCRTNQAGMKSMCAHCAVPIEPSAFRPTAAPSRCGIAAEQSCFSQRRQNDGVGGAVEADVQL